MSFIFIWALISLATALMAIGLATVLEALFNAIRGYKE